ncbi:hypothetical protein ASE01_07280 [Nocardioides sp. Root190]|uniref:MXAN_6640 family putative metalloprotease n=1 Tax=Nocardioides sp. Root190 TaxID=1736488 RepID=UPI0006F9B9A4|nr:MXAN_6640 family putative metalloprotease [Nocardioides sp. Root190]KRB77971.1 hypothetical protein ASE01_07280 [Nocardioides sp. Root190]
MTFRSRASVLTRLLPLLAALLVLPFLTSPAQADPDGSGDQGDPAAVTTPQEVAEEALAAVEEIIEAAPELTTDAPADGLRPAGKDLTLALRDLSVSQADLPKGKRAAAARLLARPTDTSSECFNDQDLACYGARPDKVECNAAVCVHWVEEGPHRIPTENDDAGGSWAGSNPAIPDYVEFTLNTMKTVATKYVGAGYRPVVSDGGADGTPQMDIYLGQLGNVGAYGYCTIDDNSISAHVPAAAYCVLDNDFAEFGVSPRLALRATAAHEYFHAVQFAYDVNEDAWLMEATATWAEDEVYDTINDNWNYLPFGSLAIPTQSLDIFNDLGQYGNWIFFRFLSERYPSAQGGMSTVVLDIWKRTPTQYSVQAIRNALALRNTTVPTQFALFTVWNRRPSTYYDEGSAYKASPIRAGYRLTPANPKKVVSVRLDHLAYSTYRFTRPATGAQQRLSVKLNLNSLSTGGAAVVTTKVKGYLPTSKVVTLNSNGDGAPNFPFRLNMEWVDVTVINASTRYSGCGDPDRDATYTCQGFALDDERLQTISVRAYRG